MRKNWRAGPPARQPAGRAQKRNPFYHSGQPGPPRLIRAKNGPGQNGPGWPVLTPLNKTNNNLLITSFIHVISDIVRTTALYINFSCSLYWDDEFNWLHS